MMRTLPFKKYLFYLSGVFILLLFTPFWDVHRTGQPGAGGEGGEDMLLPGLMATDNTIIMESRAKIDVTFGRHVPGGNDLLGGGDLLDEEDLLERKLDDDVGEYDLELIEAEEGGDVEVWDNEIDIPENALDEDTLIGIYIPRSSFIEYWVYPPSLTFNDTVEVKLSYQFADLMWVDESNISVVQWSPLLQRWQDTGGTVDTLNNEVHLKINSFPPPTGNFSRFALADHN